LTPYVIASSALGRTDLPPTSERITFGLLGCGVRGMYVTRAMTRRGAQLVAACDCYRDRRRRAVSQYSGTAYADFRDVLALDDVDAVLIATPEHWHAVMAIEACRCGKDVFCEKPLSGTIREARAILAAARRYGRVFQMGTQQRSDHRFRFACELIRNGRIGEVREVSVSPGFSSQPCPLPAEPVPRGLDWDMWLGPAPWAPYHPQRCEKRFAWWNWLDYSGGQTTDHGAHDFDIVQWGLGMDGSGPVEVFPPDGRRHRQLTFRYSNGVQVRSGREGWQKRWALVTFKGTDGSVSVWRGGLETVPSDLATTRIGPGEIHLHRSDDHVGNFLECVRTRQRPVADVEAGASSAIVCHLANIAYSLKRPLKWDPCKNRFPADDDVDRLLHRPYRQPWRL